MCIFGFILETNMIVNRLSFNIYSLEMCYLTVINYIFNQIFKFQVLHLYFNLKWILIVKLILKNCCFFCYNHKLSVHPFF